MVTVGAMLGLVRVLAVAVAGSVGALCRYGLGVAVGVQSFPWTTLGINVLGSFLLGVVLVAGPSWLSGSTVTALTVGFLGAFTTFSTFSFETQTLLRTGRGSAAVGYVVLSVVLGVVAAAIGYVLGRVFVD